MNYSLRYSLLGAVALTVVLGALGYRLAGSIQSAAKNKPSPSVVVEHTQPVEQSEAKGNVGLSTDQRTATINAYSKLPLSFEENKGQVEAGVKFMARGNGYSLYLRPSEAVLSLRNTTRPANGAPAGNSILSIKLDHANASATVRGADALPGRNNYFVGNSGHYATDVSTFKKVFCDNVYAGVDMVYYGNQRQLEYDFVVAPGVDPSVIRLAFTGSNKISVVATGDLAIRVGDTEVMQHKPVIYQTVAGARKDVAGAYEIVSAGTSAQDATIVGFKVAAYDRSIPLVIDPVLVYATFYGDKPNTSATKSDHSGDDIGLAVAIDSNGSAYVVGKTNTYEFPLVGNIETVPDPIDHAKFPTAFHSFPANYHGFITKFSPSGSGLVYSTYLAGTGNDECRGVAVDSLNNVYICGATTSSDFPLKNAQHAYSGGHDAFLMKLNAAGSDIVFSTYLGGSGDDFANDIALDPSGNVVVVGTTASANFVTAHPVQPAFGGGASDAFVAKFTADGSVNIFTTFLGGTGDETGNGVAIDASGNVYVTGSTTSLDFPIANPFQVNNAGGADAFVTKLNSSGTLLVYSTYLGGGGDDIGNGIAVDSTGNVYITGSTASSNFPTISPTILPVQANNGGVSGTTDAFVSKFNLLGSQLIFSTYLGGTMNDVGKRVRVDARNAIYVSGTTTLTSGSTAAQNNFPTAPAANTLQPGHAGLEDGFLAKFNPTGTPLVYSTYIGSDTHVFVTDNGIQNASAPTSVSVNGMAVDNNGNAYLTGSTDGSFYYTFGAYSDIAPAFPIAGEDFPAPHVVEITDASGNIIAQPAEHNTTLNIDENDIIIAKIADSSPIITSPTSAVATNGINFNAYVITATNSPQSFDAAGLPPGLSVSTVSGQISGIPSQDGVYSVVITATNQSGTGSQILIISVSSAKPNMTSKQAATANVGSVFQFTLTADNNPGSFALTAVQPTTALPVGLTLDAVTGLISGIPVVEGTYQFSATASNANGTSLPQTFTITVLPAIPVISSPVNVQALLNTPFSYAITATGNPQSYGTTPNTGTAGNIVSLPIGLQLNTTTGFITGSPNQLGFFKFTVSASNAGGTGTQSLNLTVIPALVPIVSSSSNVTGIFNEPFTFTITANNNPLVYGVVGALPVGLSLNDQTGVISGIPQVTGTFNLTQTAANVAGQGTKTLTIQLNPPAVPVISSPLTASAVVNAPFEYDILATNHPTSFNAIGLPGGLAIDTTTGKITGTPTVSGQFNVTIQATNLGGTGSATLVLTVAPQQTPIIVSPNQANAFVGIPFSYQIVATANPMTFGSSALPANLTLSSTGLISGTPTTAGNFPVTISATNPVGTGSKTLTITVTAPVAPAITSPLAVNGIDGTAFTYRITATGIGPILFTAGGLPAGLSLVGDTIVGTPTNGVTQVALTAYSPATNPTMPGGAANPLGVAPTTATLTINIAASAASIINSNLTAIGTVGVPFQYVIQASGSAPLTLSTSALPAGLTLVGNTIQGTPTSASVTLNGAFPVTLTASNPYTSNNTSKTLMITINAAVPAFTSSSFATGTDGVPFRYVIAATGTQVITYSATGLPTGLTLSGNVISGTPTSASVGTTIVALTATNNGGASNMQLGIQINPAAPVLSIPTTVTGSAGVPFTFTLTASGSPQINYSIPNLPAGLMVDIDKIDGTPTTPGIYNVIVSANNPGGTDNRPLTIVINPAPPTITAAQISGFDQVPLVPFTLQVTGAQPIAFSAVGLPNGVTIDPALGIISGTPIGFGSSSATVTASNSGGTGQQTIVFNIAASKPTITSPLIVQATPGVPFVYTITATGSPSITFQVSNLPGGLTASGNTISGTPTGPLGSKSVTLIAVNAYGSDQQTLDIDVQQTPPTITNTNLQASGQQFAAFAYTLTATGSPPLSFAATGLPAGLTLNTTTGLISGAPTVIGSFNVPISATNLFGTDATKTLVITVAKAPPKITSKLVAGAGLNEPFTYTITATGSPTIVFGAQNLPPGLNIDQNTGIISGTPITVGNFPVTVLAANTAGSDTRTLTISVTANPPSISSPLAATTGTVQNFTYTITATGEGPLTYSATNLPPGMTFSNNTISGIAAQAGTYNVTITATNPLGTDTETLVITVVSDTDGDGFPDDLEIFLGTNPNDPNSNLFVGGHGNTRVLNITSMAVKLNFKSGGQDTITVKGTLDLDPGFNATGAQGVIYVSGVAAKITVNARGSSSAAGLSLKSKSGGGNTPFSVTFGKGSFAAKLAKVGMSNADIRTPQTVGTQVIVFLDNTLYKSDKVLTYTARQGKNGSARQSN